MNGAEPASASGSVADTTPGTALCREGGITVYHPLRAQVRATAKLGKLNEPFSRGSLDSI